MVNRIFHREQSILSFFFSLSSFYSHSAIDHHFQENDSDG